MNDDHAPSPFNPEQHEARLNKIFAQIDDANEGVRCNAATALWQWLQNHRGIEHGLRLRLTLAGSSAERTLSVIHELERKAKRLEDENQLLRQRLGPRGLQRMERHQRVYANGHLAEFLEMVKAHLYQPPVSELPRGTAKILAQVVGCSETTARVMLRGERAIRVDEIEKIRKATPIAPPQNRKGRARRPQRTRAPA
jgi:hypothetical protein